MLKILTIGGNSYNLISIVNDEDTQEIQLECEDRVVFLRNLEDRTEFMEDLMEIMQGNGTDCIQLKDTTDVKVTIPHIVMDLTNYGVIDYDVQSRATGYTPVFTDDGVRELNYLDIDVENKIIRINMAGEFGDMKAVPQRGSSYKNLAEVIQKAFKEKTVDLRSNNGIIELENVKFKLGYI